MKILLCHNFYQLPGGEDQIFADEGWLLESRGHQVVRFTQHNDSIHSMRRWDLAKRTLWNRDTYQRLRELMQKERPVLMHCTNTFPLISPAAYDAARAEGVAVVQSLHNYRLHCSNGYFFRDGKVCEDCLGKSMAWRGAVRGCYRDSRTASAVVVALQGVHRAANTWNRSVDLFLTSSEFSRQKFIEGGLSEEQIVVKPNLVRPDPGPGEGQGGYAVFVGRFSQEKGISTLLEAWRRLPNDVPLKFVGDGPLADDVRQAAADDARIEWLGWRPLEEVCKIVGDASFLLMTSVWYETFGRTMAEAFAKGTPVIASRLGVMTELVDEGRTGRHFEPGDAHDLAAKVQQLAGDDAVRATMRTACRKEYETKYTAEVNYPQLLAAYEQALRNMPAASGATTSPTNRRPNSVKVQQPVANGQVVTPWPRKVDLFGVQATPTTYDKASDAIFDVVDRGESGVVACHAVHAIVTASCDPALRDKVNAFDMITPDGQPVRWAMNLLHRTGLRERVYGPELMLRLCRRAAKDGVSIYLYGGGPGVLDKLKTNLRRQCPGLQIAGSESPPFRELTAEEDAEVVERINSSGAGLVFIGLGCPKQDLFAYDHRDRIEGVQLCVGAAFDFHAGVKPMAPKWMQRNGLEWVFRLLHEPRRLFRRYLVTNSIFVAKTVRALVAGRTAAPVRSGA